MFKCACGGEAEIIGHYSMLIALDDSVDVLQMLCKTCGKEWEQ